MDEIFSTVITNHNFFFCSFLVNFGEFQKKHISFKIITRKLLDKSLFRINFPIKTSFEENDTKIFILNFILNKTKSLLQSNSRNGQKKGRKNTRLYENVKTL